MADDDLDPETTSASNSDPNDDEEEMVSHFRSPVYIHHSWLWKPVDYIPKAFATLLASGMIFWDKGIEGKLMAE
jgi:hypothetical protein